MTSRGGEGSRRSAPTWPPPQRQPSEQLHALADNCDAAARRLEATDQAADLRDAAALRGAAAIHRRDAEIAWRQERDAAAPSYWWQDRD